MQDPISNFGVVLGEVSKRAMGGLGLGSGSSLGDKVGLTTRTSISHLSSFHIFLSKGKEYLPLIVRSTVHFVGLIIFVRKYSLQWWPH
jgi:hypothetical protein